MGIYNRDYYRNDNRTWREQWLTSGCKWIILANVAVFLLQLVTRTEVVEDLESGRLWAQKVSVVSNALQLSPTDVLHGQVWRLLTYAFCHSPDQILHIVFNMLFLAWFGQELERMYGTREFVLFYLAAAFVSGIAFFVLAEILHDTSPAVGASGAIMAIVMVYAMHFPRHEIFLFGLFRIQIRFLVLFYILFDLYPVLRALGGASGADGIAHSAHLGGLAFGFAYHRLGLRLDRLPVGWQRFRQANRVKRSKSIRIFEPPPPKEVPKDLDRQVDAILEKILAHGESSLSEGERDLLRRASERYKSNQRNP